jgi:hypothetical protein
MGETHRENAICICNMQELSHLLKSSLYMCFYVVWHGKFLLTHLKNSNSRQEGFASRSEGNADFLLFSCSEGSMRFRVGMRARRIHTKRDL